MIKPRVGAICRGDTGGLASQTWDFYNHMHPSKVMLINLDVYTGQTTDETKYPGAFIVRNYPTTVEWEQWLTDLDVVFTVECPYDHELYNIARARGIKTVEQFNFEMQQFLQQPGLPKPDLLLAPSPWHMDDMKRFGNIKYLHVPVDRQRFPFKLRTEAKKFLHIAGHKTLADRNGTAILLEALPYIRSDIQITIRTQDDLPRPYTDHRLTIIRDDVRNNTDLYNGEDVLILPRRYGGLSLQLNEALSQGMPAIMLDIPPQSNHLSKSWLIPATLKEQVMVKTMIDVYECTPQALAAKIDEFAKNESDGITGCDGGLLEPDLMHGASEYANYMASQRDWKVMKPQYEALLQELCA